MFTFKKNNNIELTDEEKRMAKELNAVLEKKSQEIIAALTSENEEELSIRPEEQLACNIAMSLAEMTAERLDAVLLEMEPDLAKTVARRLERSEAETMVNMIQAIFLTNGLVCAAEDLDVLKECEAFDNTVYMYFQDELMDAEAFDSVRIEDMFEEYYRHDRGNLLRFPMEVMS